MLTHPNRPRTPVSKRLLSSEPQIPVIPSAPQYQPSRRREEAKVLQNLRRRLNAAKVVQANRPEPVEARSCANNNLSPEDTDNRPYLLQKVIDFPFIISFIIRGFITSYLRNCSKYRIRRKELFCSPSQDLPFTTGVYFEIPNL
ncbi:hypothetical protein YQE_01653, partial [Dendroctonus ponderosae]